MGYSSGMEGGGGGGGGGEQRRGGGGGGRGGRGRGGGEQRRFVGEAATAGRGRWWAERRRPVAWGRRASGQLPRATGRRRSTGRVGGRPGSACTGGSCCQVDGLVLAGGPGR